MNSLDLELRSTCFFQVGSGASPRHIAAELQSKQDLSVALREATENMLKKLRDLGANLVAVAAPENKPIITKEVCDCKLFG